MPDFVSCHGTQHHLHAAFLASQRASSTPRNHVRASERVMSIYLKKNQFLDQFCPHYEHYSHFYVLKGRDWLLCTSTYS